MKRAAQRPRGLGERDEVQEEQTAGGRGRGGWKDGRCRPEGRRPG